MELWKNFNYELDDESLLRTSIKDIKFQNMFQLFIKDYKQLKVFSRPVDKLDLLFDIKDMSTDSILFYFSIISWKLIVENLKWQDQWSNMTVKINSNPCEQVIRRCLGYQSWNGDKRLQYAILPLDKYEFTGNLNLRFFYDNPINKET